MSSERTAPPKAERRTGCLKRLGIAVLVVLAGSEVFLRVHYGLGDPPLYMADAKCGYRMVPSQHYRRFGCEYTVNALSQRSVHDSRTKPPLNTRRILCLGDSITNGGVTTDDRETYPALLEKDLNASGSGKWEVLNASSGGWAPGNELGYLEEFGTCASDIVVVQVAAHDLYQPFASDAGLGSRSFPTTKPPLALVELFNRYLLPRLGLAADPPDPGVVLDSRTPEELSENQRTIEGEVAAVRRGGAKPVIWYVDVPPRSKVGVDLGPDNIAFDALTRQMDHLHVPIISLGSEIDAAGGNALFRDVIHPNAAGDQVIARLMAARLLEMKP